MEIAKKPTAIDPVLFFCLHSSIEKAIVYKNIPIIINHTKIFNLIPHFIKVR